MCILNFGEFWDFFFHYPDWEGERGKAITYKERDRANQVHLSSLEPGDDKGQTRGVDQVPAGKTDIQLSLDQWVREADLSEDGVEVVRDERVATPLSEETEQTTDQKTAAHTSWSLISGKLFRQYWTDLPLRIMSPQDCFEASSSILMVSSI
jgi:hypothetical protein